MRFFTNAGFGFFILDSSDDLTLLLKGYSRVVERLIFFRFFFIKTNGNAVLIEETISKIF